MSEEKRKAAEQIGTLGSCLIEGDPEQKARERKIKRRALGISVSLQCAALVALVLIPLLGRTEKISYSFVTPIPPYHHSAPPLIGDRTTHQPPPRGTTTIFQPTDIPPRISTRDNPAAASNSSSDEIDIGPLTPGPTSRGPLDISDNRVPLPPTDETSRNQKKRISVGGAVQQAMLVHRVDPSYPTIAKQIGKSGQVHLRAIISTEGNIESLQVIDGDPMFVRSALEAVQQWRYQPTKLNGQAVEVETIITVVYTVNR